MKTLKARKPAKRFPLIFAACALAFSTIIWSAACTPRAVSGNYAGKEKQPSTAIESSPWSRDSDCALCHSVEAGSLADGSCLASTHQKEGLGCIDCHTDEPNLIAAHEKATASEAMPKKLKKTEVDESTCTTCHGSYEELAKTTSDRPITDSKGTAVNPHEAPGLTEGHGGNLTCMSCHSMHRESDAAENAHGACLNCHHEDVFECGTCHS